MLIVYMNNIYMHKTSEKSLTFPLASHLFDINISVDGLLYSSTHTYANFFTLINYTMYIILYSVFF